MLGLVCWCFVNFLRVEWGFWVKIVVFCTLSSLQFVARTANVVVMVVVVTCLACGFRLQSIHVG